MVKYTKQTCTWPSRVAMRACLIPFGDRHELVQRLQGLDPTKAQVPPDPTSIDLLMAKLDTDGKGYVDFDDFLNGSLKASTFAPGRASSPAPGASASSANGTSSTVTSPYKTTPTIAIGGRSGVDDVFSIENGSPLINSPLSSSQDDHNVERLRATNHQLSLVR